MKTFGGGLVFLGVLLAALTVCGQGPGPGGPPAGGPNTLGGPAGSGPATAAAPAGPDMPVVSAEGAGTASTASVGLSTGVVGVLPGTRRDPFWPVGFAPRRVEKAGGSPSAPASAGVTPAPRPPDWDEARRHLDIRGVTRMGRDKSTGRASYFAAVNGRVVEEGESVSVVWDGRVYRWRVSGISPAGVQLTKLDLKGE